MSQLFLIMPEKPLKILIRFFKRKQKQPCIIFLGGFPYKSQLSDGYFQRIYSIVNQFQDFKQIHIDRNYLPKKDSWLDEPHPGVITISIRKNLFARIIAVLSLLIYKRLYIHSIYPLKYLKFFLRLPSVKTVIDFHGIVPEELLMMGDSTQSIYFDRMESYVINKADHYIFVSQAMADHFKNKYKSCFKANYTILPIVPELLASLPRKFLSPANTIIVYAGGLQKWQMIGEMVSAIKDSNGRYHFKLFTSQTEKLEAIINQQKISLDQIEIGSKTHSELYKIYPECHFGFMLREDNLINRVASPTKLIEYMAFGIIPIIINKNIGDFYTMGYQFVSLDDFIQNQLPSQVEFDLIIQKNFLIYKTLLEKYNQDMQTIKEFYI